MYKIFYENTPTYKNTQTQTLTDKKTHRHKKITDTNSHKHKHALKMHAIKDVVLKRLQES